MPPAASERRHRRRTGTSRRRARIRRGRERQRPTVSAACTDSHMSVDRQPSAPGAPAAVGPYSHAVRRRRAAVLLGPDAARPGDRRARRGRARRAGAPLPGEPRRPCARPPARSLADAVRLTVYVTDIGAFAEVNEVYGAYFAADPPARTTIGVAALPRGAQVEMDADRRAARLSTPWPPTPEDVGSRRRARGDRRRRAPHAGPAVARR